jgi:hypothetical protein
MLGLFVSSLWLPKPHLASFSDRIVMGLMAHMTWGDTCSQDVETAYSGGRSRWEVVMAFGLRCPRGGTVLICFANAVAGRISPGILGMI